VSDEIRLTMPRDPDFYRVAHLVVGGLAVRLNLTFEELEDIELALDGLLERDEGDGEITLALELHDGAIGASLGPFQGDAFRNELEATPGDELGLRRILETVAENVRIGERDGESGHWVEFTKTIHPAPPAEA
jgi:hypothetical protein